MISQQYLNDYFNAIKASYLQFNIYAGLATDNIDRFNNSIRADIGKKYIKVIKDGSVHSFIVNTETDKQFKLGDILFAASFKSPARNVARGNIFDGYNIDWHGAKYLR